MYPQRYKWMGIAWMHRKIKYAEYQDMTIVSEFSDEGFSGKNIKGRPEFTRMMEKIESVEDGVDFVLVFKLSFRA